MATYVTAFYQFIKIYIYLRGVARMNSTLQYNAMSVMPRKSLAARWFCRFPFLIHRTILIQRGKVLLRC